MMIRPRSILRSSLFLLALAITAPPALAQDGGASSSLSSDDVSDREVNAAAHIIVTMQIHRQEMRRRMMERYGNPQEMDSTQRREARRRIREKRQDLFQQTAQEQDLSPQRLTRIMKAARTDSALQTRMQRAVRTLQQEQMSSRPDMQRRDSSAVDSSANARPKRRPAESDSLQSSPNRKARSEGGRS